MTTKKRLRIGIDMDGVVSDFVGTFIPLVKEKYGIDMKRDDIYVHDLFLVLGITEEEAGELIVETLSHPIDPMPGAVEGLKRLYENHDLHLITARPRSTMSITKAWLSSHDIPYHSLAWLTEGNKHLAEENLDVIIDDHLREVLRFRDKAKHLVIFDHPWNQSKNLRGLFTRVRTWKEIEMFVNKLAEA